jgi:hypothetical protein
MTCQFDAKTTFIPKILQKKHIAIDVFTILKEKIYIKCNENVGLL